MIPDYLIDQDNWFLPKQWVFKNGDRILWYWPDGNGNYTSLDRMFEIERGVDEIEVQIEAVFKKLGLEKRE